MRIKNKKTARPSNVEYACLTTFVLQCQHFSVIRIWQMVPSCGHEPALTELQGIGAIYFSISIKIYNKSQSCFGLLLLQMGFAHVTVSNISENML